MAAISGAFRNVEFVIEIPLLMAEAGKANIWLPLSKIIKIVIFLYSPVRLSWVGGPSPARLIRLVLLSAAGFHLMNLSSECFESPLEIHNLPVVIIEVMSPSQTHMDQTVQCKSAKMKSDGISPLNVNVFSVITASGKSCNGLA